jgi:hypothetical protein
MTRRVLTLLAAMVFVSVVYPAVSYAQEGATADIGFAFVAAGQTMPAGKYDLTSSSDASTFTLARAGGGGGVFLVPMTRLAAAEPPSNETRFVFDKVGSTYYLSEVWLPGEDGYLFYAAKEKHTHQIVKGQKKAK